MAIGKRPGVTSATERSDTVEPLAGTGPSDPFTDEYRSLALGAPSWGALSVLAATPGLLVPWLLPTLILNVGWDGGLRQLLLLVPVSAAAGALFAVVELRRRGRTLLALVGLVLNLGLVAAAGALILRFWLR